jgi:hypothetical protein
MCPAMIIWITANIIVLLTVHVHKAYIALHGVIKMGGVLMVPFGLSNKSRCVKNECSTSLDTITALLALLYHQTSLGGDTGVNRCQTFSVLLRHVEVESVA